MHADTSPTHKSPRDKMPSPSSDGAPTGGLPAASDAPVEIALSTATDHQGRTVPWMARTLHRLYNAQAQKILSKEGISIAHWIYLRVLAERGPLNQRELSKRAGIAFQTAVPALDSMEKRGLVKRTRDPGDRRKYDVTLTDDGRQLIERAMPEINQLFAAAQAGISPESMATFWQVAHQIAANLSATMVDGTVLD